MILLVTKIALYNKADFEYVLISPYKDPIVFTYQISFNFSFLVIKEYAIMKGNKVLIEKIVRAKKLANCSLVDVHFSCIYENENNYRI